MNGLIGKLVDPLKTLPGFAWVVIIVTIIWTRMVGTAELSAWETLILTLVCWVAFRAGAIFVDPLYDRLYRPQRSTPFRWKGADLKRARDGAAGAIFNVADYDAAGASASLHPNKKLYDLAKTLARNTKPWEAKIGPLIDWSKMARTFIVFSVASTLLLLLAEVSPEIKNSISGYTQPLGFIGTIWVQPTLAIISIVVCIELRLRHNIELYNYVKEHVVHVHTEKGEVPYLFDEILSGDLARNNRIHPSA